MKRRDFIIAGCGILGVGSAGGYLLHRNVGDGETIDYFRVTKTELQEINNEDLEEVRDQFTAEENLRPVHGEVTPQTVINETDTVVDYMWGYGDYMSELGRNENPIGTIQNRAVQIKLSFTPTPRFIRELITTVNIAIFIEIELMRRSEQGEYEYSYPLIQYNISPYLEEYFDTLVDQDLLESIRSDEEVILDYARTVEQNQQEARNRLLNEIGEFTLLNDEIW